MDECGGGCVCVSRELTSLQTGYEEGVGNGKKLQRLEGPGAPC